MRFGVDGRWRAADQPAAKRNALNDATVLGLEAFFTAPPAGVRAVVLDADGDHFSAGLDLSELTERDAFGALEHSRMWHRVFDRIEHGTLPVISVLKGAVVGGGLELASTTHIRVAETSTFYALPEGQHGLFVGGGGSVRIPRLIGAHRMADMMLTGRVLVRGGGAHPGLVALPRRPRRGPGEGAGTGRQGRRRTRRSRTSPCCRRCPRITQASPEEGYLLESLMAAVAGSSNEAQTRMRAFLDGRAGKVQRS